MTNKRIVDAWIKKADQDYFYASASLDEELEFYDLISFHFHQAVEKYFKALIIYHNLEFKKIHDLMELHKMVINLNDKLQDLNEDCIFLNRFYIETRYPVHWPSNITKEDAEAARKHAGHIKETIVNLIK
ncbi:HEPN domain-containing protein [bacterium]|nr:HEPN domain-containing protein [bacterium]